MFKFEHVRRLNSAEIAHGLSVQGLATLKRQFAEIFEIG